MRGADGFVYFDFVATFTFLMLVGRWLQQKAIERNRRQLLSAHAGPPAVRDAASGEKIDASAIRIGTAFAVDPGQTVPVRARLNSATATLGLEWISGESDTATSRLRRLGVFIRNAALWAKLDRVRNVTFDKTGTLTLEKFRRLPFHPIWTERETQRLAELHRHDVNPSVGRPFSIFVAHRLADGGGEEKRLSIRAEHAAGYA